MATISYHDVLLHEADWQLLTKPCWLNDQIIAFFYEYLSQEEAVDSDICFLAGAACFLVLNGEMDDLKASFSRPLKLHQRRLIFAAVNDNSDVTHAEGGSHWSLLIWDRDQSKFFHLDSCGGFNCLVANALAKKLHSLMAIEGCPELITPSVPQQRNGYDCALYVMKFTQILAKPFTDWQAALLKLNDTVTPDRIEHSRQELLQLILSKR